MSASQSAPFLTPEALLQHWQGCRRLTRRVIAAFPDDQLFAFSIGGMRPFGEMALELLAMTGPTVRGLVSREWNKYAVPGAMTQQKLLEAWDKDTEELDRLWPKIDPERFQQTETAFGQWTAPVHDLILYVVDNETHHRGQGYVYLRALGIEPPHFWERD